MRAKASALVLPLGCLLLSPGCGRNAKDQRSAPSAPSAAQNLVLITLDTVRADRLSAYGYAGAETPNLERLAREGTRFDQAFSAVPLTLPSHATILTGTLPARHGLRNNGAGRLPAGIPTLATALSNAGFQTGAFVASFVLDRRFGLDRGFAVYDDEIERDPSAARTYEAERPGPAVTDRALGFLDKALEKAPQPPPEPAKRFFLWLHLYDAHAPYAPPEPYRSRHPQDPYDGEIALVDAQIGRVLERLDAKGALASTLIAVVADHGEALGEHGELTHGLLIYDATLRVPLLLRGPGVPGGTVHKTPVSLVDLCPSLLGLLGVRPTQPGASDRRDGSDGQDGRDLSEAIRLGRNPEAVDVYAESDYARIFGWSSLASLRRGRLKYIDAPTAELFDLGNDPGERTNLLSGGGRRPDLDERIVSLRELPWPPPPKQTPGGPEAASDREAAARLASLGYVGGATGPRPAPAVERTRPDPKAMVELFREFEAANRANQAGRPTEAAKRLEPLVERDPKNPVFRGLLAQTCRASGDLARAHILYRQAVDAAPDDPEVRYELGVTLNEANLPHEALGVLSELLNRHPDRSEAHNAQGISLAMLGKMNEALQAFERASRLDSRDARPWNNRANILRQLGRLDEAAELYKSALSRAPRYAEPLNGLGVLEVSRDRAKDALPLFERALSSDPTFHEARLNRGIAYDTLGDRGSAASAYRDFLKNAAADPRFATQREIARRLLAKAAGPAASKASK